MRLLRVLVNSRHFDQTESTNSIKNGQTKWEKAYFYVMFELQWFAKIFALLPQKAFIHVLYVLYVQNTL